MKTQDSRPWSRFSCVPIHSGSKFTVWILVSIILFKSCHGGGAYDTGETKTRCPNFVSWDLGEKMQRNLSKALCTWPKIRLTAHVCSILAWKALNISANPVGSRKRHCRIVCWLPKGWSVSLANLAESRITGRGGGGRERQVPGLTQGMQWGMGISVMLPEWDALPAVGSAILSLGSWTA